MILLIESIVAVVELAISPPNRVAATRYRSSVSKAFAIGAATPASIGVRPGLCAYRRRA